MTNNIGNIEGFRPMLAASLPCSKGKTLETGPTDENVLRDLNRLDWRFGFLCSPKLDGIRAVKHPTMGLVSRTLKPIPNQFIQHCLNLFAFNHFDGELVLGDWKDNVPYNTNQSWIMSEAGKPQFTYAVFDDLTHPGAGYHIRVKDAEDRLRGWSTHEAGFQVVALPQKWVKSPQELLEYEQEQLALGVEGIIVRHPGCPYKNNRATFLEQSMIKMKRFEDAEMVIEDFEELYHNANEPTIDKLGYQRRSAHLDGMVPAGTLGKLIGTVITGRFKGTQAKVGSGLDDSLRAEIWESPEKYRGGIVKFKYQPHGSKDKCRTPIYLEFLGFRSKDDL